MNLLCFPWNNIIIFNLLRYTFCCISEDEKSVKKKRDGVYLSTKIAALSPALCDKLSLITLTNLHISISDFDLNLRCEVIAEFSWCFGYLLALWFCFCEIWKNEDKYSKNTSGPAFSNFWFREIFIIPTQSKPSGDLLSWKIWPGFWGWTGSANICKYFDKTKAPAKVESLNKNFLFLSKLTDYEHQTVRYLTWNNLNWPAFDLSDPK